MNFVRALIGLVVAVVYHLPRVFFQLLLVSYHAAFNPQDILTANPKEHLRRARKLLGANRNSQLLYAALEMRFALERMADFELVMANEATQRMIDEPDPVKKTKNLRRLSPEASHAQQIFLINKTTGERVAWGQYRPLDLTRVREIQGRLGDLLHPKRGLGLGLPSDPWYEQTRHFLLETHDYLCDASKANTPFFAFEGLAHIEMVRLDNEEPN
jgi:hypothetical protein